MVEKDEKEITEGKSQVGDRVEKVEEEEQKIELEGE